MTNPLFPVFYHLFVVYYFPVSLLHSYHHSLYFLFDIDNFPIDYVKEHLNETIGINIITQLSDSSNIENIKDYILNIMDIFFVVNNKYDDDIYKNNVYNIPVNKKNPIEMSISVEEKKQLVRDGYEFIKKNLNLNKF